MSRDDSALLDMLNASRSALEFLGGRDQRAFREDRKTQSAILHQLLLLGEGTKRLSPAFREQHEHIAWKAIAGLRDRLIHAYDRVDLMAVWETLERDLPDLITFLESVCPRPADGGGSPSGASP